MARRGLTLTDPTTGQRMTFLKTSADTDGALLALETTFVASRGRPPLHVHPAQDERYVVLDGELHARLGRTHRTLGPGEVLEIPAGTRHAVHGTARARWETRPALGSEQFLTALCDPHAAASARLATAWRHRAEFRLTGPAGLLLALVGRLMARRT